MTRWLALGAALPFAALVAALVAQPALAQQHEVATRPNIEYVEHDGVKLAGDLYLPKGVAKAPVVIGIHGGGWQGGSPAAYKHWGPLSRQARLRHVRHQVSARQARHLSEGGL